VFRLDDDYAVGAAAAVHREVGGVLQHTNRRDVIGADSAQAAVRAGLDRNTIEDVQRLSAGVRGGAADVHQNAAVGCLLNIDSGNATGEDFLDRVAWCRMNVVRRYRRRLRRGSGLVGPGGSTCSPSARGAAGGECAKKTDAQVGST